MEGPALGPEVLWIEPGEGAGPLPRSPAFRVQLDRPLAPDGVPAGAVVVASGASRFPLSIVADPVTQALVIRARNLPPNASFRLELDGLVDLEGRAMDAPVVVRFATSEESSSDAPPRATFGEAQPILSRCAACHDGETAALGLDLGSADGVRSTAIGVPAREVASGRAGFGLFGLTRIAPGSPARSYLVWKLTGDEHVPGGLRPEHGGIPLEDAATLVDWIAGGAPLGSTSEEDAP